MVIDEYSYLVARLPAEGYGTTEFDMSDGPGLMLPSKARPAGAKLQSTADRIASSMLEQPDEKIKEAER